MTDALFDTQTPAVVATPAAVAGQVGVHGDVVEASSCTPVLEIHAVGIPQPQGSKKGFVNPKTGHAIIVDDNKQTLRTWRDDVKAGAQDAILAREGTGDPFTILGGAVEVDITFLMPRPKGHYGTGKNATTLRASAPRRPTTKPDVDKLLRSTLDALKAAGVYLDDSLVVNLTGRKVYATGAPGAHIHVFTGEPA